MKKKKQAEEDATGSRQDQKISHHSQEKLFRAAGHTSYFSKKAVGRTAVRFFFSRRRRPTKCYRDWSSDVCSSDLAFARWCPSPWRLEKRAIPSPWPARP